MKVWIVHTLKVDRYTEEVVFYGVATTEKERDRIATCDRAAVITELKTDVSYLAGIEGACNFHEGPSW